MVSLNLQPIKPNGDIVEQMPDLEKYINRDAYTTRLELTKIIANNLAGYKAGVKAKDSGFSVICLNFAISYMEILLELEDEKLFTEDGKIDFAYIMKHRDRYPHL